MLSTRYFQAVRLQNFKNENVDKEEISLFSYREDDTTVSLLHVNTCDWEHF